MSLIFLEILERRTPVSLPPERRKSERKNNNTNVSFETDSPNLTALKPTPTPTLCPLSLSLSPYMILLLPSCSPLSTSRSSCAWLKSNNARVPHTVTLLPFASPRLKFPSRTQSLSVKVTQYTATQRAWGKAAFALENKATPPPFLPPPCRKSYSAEHFTPRFILFYFFFLTVYFCSEHLLLYCTNPTIPKKQPVPGQKTLSFTVFSPPHPATAPRCTLHRHSKPHPCSIPRKKPQFIAVSALVFTNFFLKKEYNCPCVRVRQLHRTTRGALSLSLSLSSKETLLQSASFP